MGTAALTALTTKRTLHDWQPADEQLGRLGRCPHLRPDHCSEPLAGIGAATATSPTNDKASAEGLAERFKERGYQVYKDSDNVWIRDPGKVKNGGLPDCHADGHA